ncbi:MAG: hypothetical protein EAZ91_12615 [Cytophagales bacterium]|nr:MAG: hypothetical protein EAZ91_12615 [Cytophagales bacterium]
MNYALLVLLALLQIVLLFRNRPRSVGRMKVRAGLNALLWLMLAGFVWQPIWTSRNTATHALLVSDEVPQSVARQVQDSLRLAKRVSATNIQLQTLDSVTVLGQQVPPDLLAHMSRQAVRWLPFEEPQKAQNLRWKGIVRVGEEQQIRGAISTPQRQKLSVRFGNQTLDSVWLRPSRQLFALRFAAPARGRTQTTLWLDDEPLDTVRFFARNTRPLTIRFLLSTPDFETKTLADWLGRQGNRVELSSQLSTGIEANVQINAAGKTNPLKPEMPDLIVTEPGLVGQSLVRNSLTEGKSVLVLGMTNPPAEAALLNRALGTNWRFERVSNEATVPAMNDLTALPFRFGSSLNQVAVRGYPMAVQTVGGRVGVSLFTETFPLKLSGDSLAYARIWNAILAKLQPVQENNILVDAPVVAGLRHEIRSDGPRPPASRIRFPNPGWQTLTDSVEVFVDDSLAAPHERMATWVRAHNRYQTTTIRPVLTHESRLPDWLWLTLILVCLTALWIEPKL